MHEHQMGGVFHAGLLCSRISQTRNRSLGAAWCEPKIADWRTKNPMWNRVEGVVG